MRPIVILATLSIAASPVLAQTNVAATIKRARVADSGRVADSLAALMDRRHLVPDEVRVLASALQELTTQFKRLQEQLARELPSASEQRKVELVALANRTFSTLARTQSRVAIACNELRNSSQADGYIGVTFADTATSRVKGGNDPWVEKFFRVPQIREVWTGSPAQKAGMREGDLWIAIDGRNLVGMQVDDLYNVLKPGARVELRVRRDGADRELPAIIERPPEYPAESCNRFADVDVFMFELPTVNSGMIAVRPQSGAVMPRMPQLRRAETGDRAAQVFITGVVQLKGAMFKSLTNEKRDALGVQPNEGVIVDDVQQESPAEAAGLRAYDVVIRVNGEKVATPFDVSKLYGTGSAITLTVVRKGETRTVTIPR